MEDITFKIIGLIVTLGIIWFIGAWITFDTLWFFHTLIGRIISMVLFIFALIGNLKDD